MLDTGVFVLKEWVHLEECTGNHGAFRGVPCVIMVKEKIECMLLGMGDVVVKTVQVSTDDCSRNMWNRFEEVHCLTSTLSAE